MSNNAFADGAAGTIPCIFSLSGLTLTDDERGLFKEANPFGFILFKRNFDTPDQARSLVLSIKELVGRDCPILIDQEGGKVQRLRPPHWREYKPMQYFGELYEQDPNAALEELRFETFRLAEELIDLGINVDCAPVLDLFFEGAHDVIGDRAFSEDPEIVARLGLSVCRHFLKTGITPIIKHIPGHGRAKADSHEELPTVTTAYDELAKTDFSPFRAIAQSDVGDDVWAMTAHIIYDDIDADHPMSVSEHSVTKVIRQDIGFNGVLIADDMDMKALDDYGTTSEKAIASLDAGCDLALYCWAEMEKMQELAENLPKTSQNTLKRLQNKGFLSDDAA